MFQKVQHGPAKHKSRCCFSLHWGRSHLVKSRVPRETSGCIYSTGRGLRALERASGILKRWRRPPIAVARDSCGALAQESEELEEKKFGLTNLEGR